MRRRKGEILMIARRFFAIEGQDGTGKTKQSQLLKRRLEEAGFSVQVISLPQYGEPSAKPIEEYLRGAYGDPVIVNPYFASMLFAYDRYCASQKVARWLKEGKVVVANRWFLSNAAYQGAKVIADARTGASFFLMQFVSWLKDVEFNKMRILEPLHIVLKMPPEISFRLKANQKLSEKDGHEKSLDYQKRVFYVFNWLSLGRCPVVNCCEDDILLTPELVHNKIWQVVTERRYL